MLLLFTVKSINAVIIPEDSINKKRLTGVLIAETGLYGGSLIGLNELWYKNYPRSGFHFFDDNREWLQVDKAGHAITGYRLGLLTSDIYQWAGLSEKKSAIWGSITGFGYLTVIEILDGFSKQWGASTGDLAANTFGTGLFLAQELSWHEQRIQLKWSFHLTDYASKKPELLGHSLPERMLKDYNGQTIWLSVNPNSFRTNSVIPPWLNIAAGYGGSGMIGAEKNPYSFNNIDRYRQYYLSLDLNWRKIPTQSKTLKFVFKTLSFIKIPFPAIEFSEKGVSGHLLYW